ncbi:MAG: PAS domain S-box protein [Pedobacter sp.]|nr:MAG: PAS domain S-box protein [Pedobacter sp.]
MFMDDLYNLEIFFESSPDLLCVAGFDGYFKKVNRAVSKVLEYTMEELLSRPINSFVHPEDLQKTINSRENVKSGNTLRHFDNRYLTKSGTVVWLSWTSVQIEGKQLIFGVAKDITLRKRLQEMPPAPQNLKVQASNVDQAWLSKLDELIRSYSGHFDIRLSTLSEEMAISERQLFRRIKTAVGVTPNRYIRLVRLRLAMEGLSSGKYRTLAEASFASGFKTPGYFNKIFKEVYGSGISEFI